MKLDRYLQIRRPIEIGFWGVSLSIAFLSETLVQMIDSDRHGAGTQIWEIVTWEASSVVALILLIPLVLYFDERFPIRWSSLKTTVLAHVGFSVVFSILHVSLMVMMRKLIYWLNGSTYDFGVLHEQFFYEYLKDARTYAIFIAVIYLYRHIVLRLQGEASLIGLPEAGEQNDIEPKPERILVKKLGREFLVRVDDIDRIEAAGNYVNLHVADRVYPLRDTMAKVERRLDSAKFRRIHRSHIVNLSRVREIKPMESGDAQVLLSNGVNVPMSRTYRSQLLENG